VINYPKNYHETPPHRTTITEKSLQSFIEDRHRNDIYQLSRIENVRLKFRIQRTSLTLSQAQIEKFKPVLNEKPTYWRLTIPISEAAQSEELVLSMQGVITSKDLPPVLKK
jgi:hypothetical protein